MWTGKMAAEALPAPACQVSVPERRWARVSLVGWSDCGRASWCRASGLMVVGTGTTRVMWAVPSASMWLELGMGVTVSDCCAVRERGRRRAASERTRRMPAIVVERRDRGECEGINKNARCEEMGLIE